jgi:hypothetical protein
VNAGEGGELWHAAYGGWEPNWTRGKSRYPDPLDDKVAQRWSLLCPDSHLPPIPMQVTTASFSSHWSLSLRTLAKLFLYCLVCNARGRNIIYGKNIGNLVAANIYKWQEVVSRRGKLTYK